MRLAALLRAHVLHHRILPPVLLPQELQELLETTCADIDTESKQLLEIVVDANRPPALRFSDNTEVDGPEGSTDMLEASLCCMENEMHPW